MKTLCTTSLLSLLLFVSACRQVRPEQEFDLAPDMPKTFSLYTEGERSLSPWWQDFDEPELARLIDTALKDNLSVQESWARLRQAQLVARKVKGSRKGNVQYDAGTRHGRQHNDIIGETNVEEYSIGLSGSYEVDLWGKLAAGQSAAELDSVAALGDVKTAMMTVSARIAELWIRIIAEQERQRLLQEQIQSNEDLLEVLEFRLANTDTTTLLDVLQQRQTIATTKSALPGSRLREEIHQLELAVLLGRNPQGKTLDKTHRLPAVKALPALGLPADLLAYRPDVAAAGLRLEGANWRVAVAKADRLPALRLTGTWRFASGGLTSLLDNWIMTLASSLTGPIFDGNTRKLEVQRTRAVVDQRLLQYKSTVLTAIKDVESALVREKRQRENIAALEAEMKISQETLDEAKQRYLNGAGDYLAVINARLKQQRVELDLLQQQAELVVYRISLYRALGGPWLNESLREFEPSNKQVDE